MERDLSVRDVLTPEYVAVSESDTVRGAVGLMREERAGCVLVVRGSEPVGIMTEWDVLGLIDVGHEPEETTVDEIMSAPLMTMHADRSLREAAGLMASRNIRNLVIESDDEVVGILTQRDVIAVAGSFTGTTTSTEDRVPSADPGFERAAIANGGNEYATQGVCESCGTLADALWDVNGRLLCSDCQTV